MKKFTAVVLLLPILLLPPVMGQKKEVEGTYRRKPFVGFVPDAATAEKIALAMTPALLGSQLAREVKFRAVAEGKSWRVSGYFALSRRPGVPGLSDPMNAQLPVFVLSRETGMVSLFTWH